VNTRASAPAQRGAPPLPLPLRGLFRELLAHGVPLGVRDYLDGLRALEAGWGGTAHPTRDELQALAETLWVRNEDERALVRRWFLRLPAPAPLLVTALQRRVDAIEGVARHAAAPPQQAAPPADRPDPTALHDPGAGALPGEGSAATAPDAPARARIELGSAREAGGLALPSVAATNLAIGEDYLLHPHAALPLRQLTVLWRRWRRAVRDGPRLELDLPGTLRVRCEQGFVGAPLMRARRRNAAQLLLLADASPSMLPWQGFLALVQESLEQGRLGRATVRWFSNVPRQRLYLSAALDESEARDDSLAAHEGAALLVISDAGSARGLLNRRRAAQTAEFLGVAAAARTRLVWVNPMPQARWAGTSAALIGADPRLTMLPLGAAEMLRAVDLLRGLK